MGQVVAQRYRLLSTLEQKLEGLMLALSFIWLVLMIVEFTRGLSDFFQTFSNAIWIVFIFDFAVKLIVSPDKGLFFRRNWVTALALLLPALRLLRIARFARLIRSASGFRSLRLARVLTSLNRGIKALGKTLGKRGFGYVMLLSLIVMLAGAAGIFAFENENGAISDYGTAVWWSAMMLTTMGSDYFPKSGEGRILCLLLAVYGFAVFGYVTAAVATFFVNEDSKDNKAKAGPSIENVALNLESQLNLLTKEVERLRQQIESGQQVRSENN